jgi:hypothetical protein
MLMHIISLDIQLPSCVTIHNQCLNIELVSPVYFGNGAVCPKLSDQQIDISTEMKARFEINTIQDEFEGALLFKLQRHSGNQYSADTSTIETNKNGAKCVQMLAAWKVKDSKPLLHVLLIEHAKEFTWNEDNLKKLYDKNFGWLKEYNDAISDTWLMDDNMALKTSFEVRGLKGNFELSISIFEEKDDYAIRPLCIDLER